MPTIHVYPKQIRGIKLHFHPRSPVGNNTEGIQHVAAGMDRLLEADARRPMQLADNDALRAIDHERALGRHERNFAHVHSLLADFLAVLEAECDMKRASISLPLAENLVGIRLGERELILHKIQHIPPIVTLDGENLPEHRL